MTRKPTAQTAQGVDPLLEAALRGELNEAQARQLSQRAPEAVTLALLALARRIAELQPRDGRSITPATPSDMIPEAALSMRHDAGRSICETSGAFI